MKSWKDKFVIYFMVGAVIVLFVYVLLALEPGNTTIEDVLEPNGKYIEEWLD